MVVRSVEMMKRVLEQHHTHHLSNGGKLTPSTSPLPNPMLLSRLVLPPRGSPGGSETPPRDHRDQEQGFSEEEEEEEEDDQGPKDFRGEF
jgi:hypothetical protein